MTQFIHPNFNPLNMRISIPVVILGILLPFAAVSEASGNVDELNKVLRPIKQYMEFGERFLTRFRLMTEETKGRLADVKTFIEEVEHMTPENLLHKISKFEEKRPDIGAKMRAEAEKIIKEKGEDLV